MDASQTAPVVVRFNARNTDTLTHCLPLDNTFSAEYSLVRMEWPRLVEAGIVSQVEYDSIIASAQPNYEHAF